MAVHNGELYLKEAIESILNQSFSNFELLIVNDCSSDQSENIILSFKDERIELINNQQNLGLTKSLNLMLRRAKGKYIARMDADDISHPDRFQMQLNVLTEKSDVGVCGSWYTRFSETEESVVKTISPSDELSVALLIKNQMGHPTIMMRKSVLDEHSITYNEELITSQDYDLWLRLSAHTKLYNIPKSLLHYRIHANQVVNKKQHIAKQFTHQARMDFLRGQGIQLTTSEDSTLFKSFFNEEMNYDELTALKSIYEKIIDSNNSTQLYVNSLLVDAFDKRLKHCIRNNWSLFQKPVLKGLIFKVSNDFKGLLQLK
jgi:glycosyltransferase involved in cell wall biosynthesis